MWVASLVKHLSAAGSDGSKGEARGSWSQRFQKEWKAEKKKKKTQLQWWANSGPRTIFDPQFIIFGLRGQYKITAQADGSWSQNAPLIQNRMFIDRYYYDLN